MNDYSNVSTTCINEMVRSGGTIFRLVLSKPGINVTLSDANNVQYLQN